MVRTVKLMATRHAPMVVQVKRMSRMILCLFTRNMNAASAPSLPPATMSSKPIRKVYVSMT